MKKHLLALLCVLALLLSAAPAASALEGEALRAADQLALLGLTDSTDYALEAPATRAQATVLLVKLAAAEKTARATPQIAPFRDAPGWAYSCIAHAAQQGWVQGKIPNYFRPDQGVTANAWFTMLLRMLGYSDKAGDFAVEEAAVFAQRIGLTARSYSGPMTRGDVFTTLLEALPFPYKDGSATVIQRLLEEGVCTRSAANALGLLDQELTARQVAERHMSAVFCLTLYSDGIHYDAGQSTGSASGFFISPDGLAVTNHHSIAECAHITATLSTGETYPVTEVLYADENIDIAVIRISKTSTAHKATSAFAYLDVVGAADLRAGDEVYTLGNPLGLGLAISAGLVSDPARTVAGYALPCIMSTADISEGSSGGALLNVYGQVVAVTSGAFLFGNNMYLAVPADPVLTADLTGPGQTIADFCRQTRGAD